MTETVHFRADTFQATIYLPRLNDLPVANIRKLFRLVFRYDRENEEAIQITGLYTQNAVEDSLQAWKVKSQECIDGYIDAKGLRVFGLKREDKLKIIQENNRLLRAVKDAKRTHEKWVNINAIFHEYRP